MELKAELALDAACAIGEGPLWHPDKSLLYWVDIPRGQLLSFDPWSREYRVVHEGKPVSGFTIQEDGSLLLFMRGGEAASWKDRTLTTVIESMPGSKDTIFNDSIADPAGRVFVGMKAGSRHKGQLYRLDKDGSIHLLLDGLGEPNGMGFTPNQKHLYLTDTFARSIFIFDYDALSGAISKQRVFVEVPEDEGMPDGMTVDAEGNLWSARWGGGCIVRYSPDGKETARVEIPVEKVSSVTFGDQDYSTLYISTSGGEDRAHGGGLEGSLFSIRPTAGGVPEYRSRVG